MINVYIIIIIIIPLPTISNALFSQQSMNKNQMELKTGEAECHQQIYDDCTYFEKRFQAVVECTE